MPYFNQRFGRSPVSPEEIVEFSRGRYDLRIAENIVDAYENPDHPGHREASQIIYDTEQWARSSGGTSTALFVLGALFVLAFMFLAFAS
jgi:hypothetical protein